MGLAWNEYDWCRYEIDEALGWYETRLASEGLREVLNRVKYNLIVDLREMMRQRELIEHKRHTDLLVQGVKEYIKYWSEYAKQNDSKSIKVDEIKKTVGTLQKFLNDL